MNENTALSEAIKKAAEERDGRLTLSCPAAFRLAKELSCSVALVGKCANDLGIKLVQCQLGCFK